MFKTLGIVEIPPQNSCSAHWKESVATRRFAGQSLLAWVTRRITDALLLDHVAVVVSGDEQARRLSDSLPADVSVFVADPDADAITRLANAVRQYETAAIVRVDLDSPFVDPTMIDRLVSRAESYGCCDYMGYFSTRGGSVLLAQLGVLAEWCRSEAVLLADTRAVDPGDRGHLTRFIYSRPDIFRLRLLPIPKPLDRNDLRLSLAVEDDWEHAQLILDALGPENLDWQQITHLLDEQPAIRERMAALNRELLEV
jgi:spore coat polysaccharide biosynthesis protein SpsF (cytidylyltransferase family)